MVSLHLDDFATGLVNTVILEQTLLDREVRTVEFRTSMQYIVLYATECETLTNLGGLIDIANEYTHVTKHIDPIRISILQDNIHTTKKAYDIFHSELWNIFHEPMVFGNDRTYRPITAVQYMAIKDLIIKFKVMVLDFYKMLSDEILFDENYDKETNDDESRSETVSV